MFIIFNRTIERADKTAIYSIKHILRHILTRQNGYIYIYIYMIIIINRTIEDGVRGEPLV